MSDLNLSSPRAIRDFLRANDLSALKKFGQNFLCDANIVEKIADTVDAGPDGRVLEIGMGLGALTQALAARTGRVVAVEIDRGLLAARAEAIEGLGNVKVVEGDILRVDLKAIWEDELGSQPFCVCGNLPYYITGPILFAVLESGLPILSMTAMVQLEVAERLCARPGDPSYGAATACVAYFCEPRVCFTVSRSCFYPSPDVDSAIIRMELGTPRVDVPYPAYRAVVRGAFAMRRKTISNNLKALASAEIVRSALREAGVKPSDRAQALSCQQFGEISRHLLAAGWTPSQGADAPLL